MNIGKYIYFQRNMVPLVNYKNTTHGTTNNTQHRYSQTTANKND